MKNLAKKKKKKLDSPIKLVNDSTSISEEIIICSNGAHLETNINHKVSKSSYVVQNTQTHPPKAD
jgi:hypothetical protein